MNLTKKKLELFLDWIADPYIHYLRAESEEEERNSMIRLLLLLHAGNRLGIFKRVCTTLNSNKGLGAHIDVNKFRCKSGSKDITELRDEFKDQLKRFMTVAAKKTMEDKDEESSEHQN